MACRKWCRHSLLQRREKRNKSYFTVSASPMRVQVLLPIVCVKGVTILKIASVEFVCKDCIEISNRGWCYGKIIKIRIGTIFECLFCARRSNRNFA